MAESQLSNRGTALAKRFEKTAAMGPMTMVAENPYSEQNPNGYINFGVSDNYTMQKEMAEFLDKNLHVGTRDLSYGEAPWGSRRLRRAMAKHMTTYFHPQEPIDPDGIVCANGVTSLIEMLAWTLGDPGDGFLLPRPIYHAFKEDFGLKGHCEAVLVSFDGQDQFAPEVARTYEQAILDAKARGVTVRAFILCNPHNPLGQCYPRATVIALMQLCAKYHIHFLSDEIYALSLYDGTDPGAVPFESVLSWDFTSHIPTELVHVLYGMSKDLACSGIRLGTLYSTNRPLLNALQGISRFHWAGSLADKAASVILEDEAFVAGFAARARAALGEAARVATETLRREGIPYLDGTSAGFFLWIDLRRFLPEGEDRWAAEKALAKRMLANGVFVTPGGALSAEKPGWFRIIFSHERAVLEEGLRRFVKTVKSDTA